VSDYVGGKVDWFGAGLPIEGELSSILRIGDLAEPDVPVCTPDETVGEVRARAEAAGWGLALVVNEHRVVLGILRRKALASEPGRRAEEAMSPGPSTFRPNVSCHEMTHYMDEHGISGAVVTTPEGVLVGYLRRTQCELRRDDIHELSRTAGWPVGT
jgi:CBS domain-containing protein